MTDNDLENKIVELDKQLQVMATTLDRMAETMDYLRKMMVEMQRNEKEALQELKDSTINGRNS